jgi:uncharacterized membrane protein YphA (DoxX/SURF4 family)
MSIRRSLALNVAPLALRLALGATFIWAGVSKIAHTTVVDDPQDLAILVEWGQIEASSSVIPDTDPVPELDPALDPDPLETDPDSNPLVPTDDESTNNADLPAVDDGPVLDDPPADTDPDPVQDDQDQETDPATDNTQPPADDAGTDDEDELVDEAQPEEDPGLMPVSYVQQSDSHEVKRVLSLALMMHHAANPGVNDAGQPLMPLWPSGLSNGSLPVVFAWVAAILELVCGAALLTGFFTRMASLPLIGTMLVAMWLTQIGPAIQMDNAMLGFLPQGVFDMNDAGYVYSTLLWQFALAAMGFAMLLIGPGCFSIDRLIFGVSASVREEEARQVEFVPMGD